MSDAKAGAPLNTYRHADATFKKKRGAVAQYLCARRLEVEAHFMRGSLLSTDSITFSIHVDSIDITEREARELYGNLGDALAWLDAEKARGS